MDNEQLSHLNNELRDKIGYTPYVTDPQTNKVMCAACHTDRSSASMEELSKINDKVKDKDGDLMPVHQCPGCKYIKGINVPLKKRISDTRKELDLHEFPTGHKFANSYDVPQDEYMFIIPSTEEATRMTDTALTIALNEMRGIFIKVGEEIKKEEIGTKSEVVIEKFDENGELVNTSKKEAVITPIEEEPTVEEVIKDLEDFTKVQEPEVSTEAVNPLEEIAEEEIEVIVEVEEEIITNPLEIEEEEDDLVFETTKEEVVEEQKPEFVEVYEEEQIDFDDELYYNEDKEVPFEEEEEDELVFATTDIEVAKEEVIDTEINPDSFVDGVGKGEDSDMGNPVNASSFFDDEDDLSDLFKTSGSIAKEVGNDVVEDTLINNFDENSDEAEDFFAGLTQSQQKPTQQTKDTGGLGSAATDVKMETDKSVEDMIRNNKETCEVDVFRTDIRDTTLSVSSLVDRSAVNALMDDYNDSEIKIAVDRILSIFKKRAARQIKHHVMINQITHGCPVIDFEGNIRLIYIDVDVMGGRYDLEREINSKIRPFFADTSDFEMMTFIIFSDEVNNRAYNKVALAVAKHIAFNLKITGVFTPISVVSDSDGYFYTTSESDLESINKFNNGNAAGVVDKAASSQIMLVSRWINPKMDAQYIYRKEVQNRTIMMNGGDISYSDLNMYMTATLKYIMLPQKPDGSINVTVTDYTEDLNLFVRDGFGILVGALVHNIKSKYPNSKVHLYYEMDPSMIPSPTVSRYFKSGAIRPININQDIVQLNKIMNITANQNGTKVQQVYVEGEPFDAPEYNSPVLKNIMLKPEFRSKVGDNKRLDWRYFGRKMIAKTLGDKMKDNRNVDINDRNERAKLVDRLGYTHIVQPQVIKAIITDEFAINAFQTLMRTCTGQFSISQYIKQNRSQVVGDDYMKTMNQQQQMYNPGVAMGMNGMNMGGGAMDPMALYQQQQMMMNMMQMNNGMNNGMNGMFPQW